MFREMRRKRQALTQAQCQAILEQGSCGVLALSGDGGYPYAVPLSYLYHQGKLYFHSAKSGHKLDALRREPKASFCVVAQDQVAPLEYTTLYRSVIVFGRLRELEDDREKRAAIETLALKYAPQDTPAHREEAIRRDWGPLCVLELTPEHISGKQGKNLIGKA
ncbi:MAG TPA: pyridoxamine 5'-phosphate oxidase family protein [Candidatus Acutalibacter pullistercoris]|uniref:Pyridoxamine 5'-phosphate oxidase family protein n=1 Tax=Candidatus Acutalibacter pullistercoris TaxID=2838418 RepID=A0A9D1YDK1_9FIRM|nr:pyridoxamine 5'-phosphate oxidase family protein [Candidatus Acutalibacter pullistercoris]